ncbi:uncharacterized protein K460DRAFT_254616, partial [Cucurbitaria berberidis CBS 394.84]
EIGGLDPNSTSIPPTHNDPPPPYPGSELTGLPTSTEERYVGPPDTRKPDSPKEQLRRCLIEIVAISVNANFDELNSALYDKVTTSHTTSILCDEEREYLLHLSQLVQKLHEKARRNQVNTMLRADKMEVYKAIYEPIRLLDTSLEAHALDLVASYTDIARHPDAESARQHSTLLAHWAQN